MFLFHQSIFFLELLQLKELCRTEGGWRSVWLQIEAHNLVILEMVTFWGTDQCCCKHWFGNWYKKITIFFCCPYLCDGLLWLLRSVLVSWHQLEFLPSLVGLPVCMLTCIQFIFKEKKIVYWRTNKTIANETKQTTPAHKQKSPKSKSLLPVFACQR